MRSATALLLVAIVATGCGDGDGPADQRADQVRAAAEDAGLPDDVVEVFVLASRGAHETFQVTYPGEDGGSIVVSQDPPRQRVDVVVAGRIVRSQVVRDGIGYQCEPPAGDEGGSLACRRTQSTLEGPGAFTEDALETFAEDLAASRGDTDLAVEQRTIAGADATCLVATPRAGTSAEVETICLSPEGAQLLVDAAGERLEATEYTTDVPEGTFDT